MKIREAEKNDINDIVRLELELNKYERRIDSTLGKFSKVKTKEWALRKLKDKKFRIFIAEERGRIIAFCMGSIIRKKPSYFPMKYAGYCDDLFVLPKYRRMGVGRRLLTKLLKWFKSKKIKYFEIDVYSNNGIAVKAYHSFGFRDYILKMRKKVI